MEKNKAKILTVVALVALAFLIVGATYAYFTAQIGDGKRAEINVTTYTTDVLTFATGDAINLEADQTTFGKDKGSVSGATYASAVLTANNKTNKAVEHYYLYLNIENNTFTYSVQDNKPELIMTITDKDGNEVKNIEGLTYTEVTDRTNKKISGYDITTKSGLVTIFNNREIIAEPKAEDKWNITITFVNYEADQNANAGKVLSTKLMIQKNEVVLLTDYVKSQFTGVQGENYLYHHDGTLENGINDNSYRYAGGSAQPGYYLCKYKGSDVPNYENGDINSSLKGDCDNVYKIIMPVIMYIDKSLDKAIANKQAVKWDSANNKCVTSTGADVSIEFEEDCTGDAYFIDGEWYGNVVIENMGAGVEREGVKNCVCFGSNESPCPADNLYRIIGVFGDRVKLIKSDYATSTLLGTDGDYKEKYSDDSSYYKGSNYENVAAYYWSKADLDNTWSDSNLNKINLNTNFINNIGKEWADKIVETTWKVGGNTYKNIGNQPAKTVYQNEIVNPVTTNSTDNKTEYSAKIGLMYASDYAFAAAPSAWTTTIWGYSDTAISTANWMYMGLDEWTISRRADSPDEAISVRYTGFVDGNWVDNYAFAVRPVFYLSSSVIYASGSGSANDPILIN